MRRFFRLLKRLLQILLLVILVGLAWAYFENPGLTTRLVMLPFGGGQGPTEPVAGGPPLDLRVAGEVNRSILPDTLQQAIAYGEQTSSHALLVFHDGALQLEHYYPGYDATTFSATQSMHKSVLAMLIGVAIRDGHIGSVDDEVGVYLEEWAGDGRGRISLRDMLQQSSGIDYPTIGWNPIGGFTQLVLGTDVEPLVLSQPLAEDPGQRFDYNSINPQALGIVIERATGMRYADYLSEALWRHTGADDAEVVLDSIEHGMARTFCCLEATARSWMAMGLLHLTEGRFGDRQIVPAGWMRQITTPSRTNPNYGYLTWLGREYVEYRSYNQKASTRAFHSEPFAARDVIYFDGFGGARVYVVPSAGLVIVRTGDLALDWDDAYLPNLLLRGLRQTRSG
jgi:CubicO group peptidase (beta-lactamase class C family)